VVVVWVEFFVAVVSPVGETVVPLLVDPVVLVTTPLTLVVFSLLVETVATGAGMTGVVDVCVVVVLEEEDCAKAPPAIKVAAIVAASKDLIMSNSPGDRGGSGDRSLDVSFTDFAGCAAASETTWPRRRGGILRSGGFSTRQYSIRNFGAFVALI
jgi:hypothetical protein